MSRKRRDAVCKTKTRRQKGTAREETENRARKVETGGEGEKENRRKGVSREIKTKS